MDVMTSTTQRQTGFPASQFKQGVLRRPQARRAGPRIVALVLLVTVIGAVTWAVDDWLTPSTVADVGDSITALSRPALVSSLQQAGYRPLVEGMTGTKIGQAQGLITELAQQRPSDWIIELGTNDSGAGNAAWAAPFAAEWHQVASSHCVIYVTVSPRSGPVASQIDSTIASLARAHSNVHSLDWGRLEYTQPGWVEPDGIHPTSEGEQELASVEVQALHSDC